MTDWFLASPLGFLLDAAVWGRTSMEDKQSGVTCKYGSRQEREWWLMLMWSRWVRVLLYRYVPGQDNAEHSKVY